MPVSPLPAVSYSAVLGTGANTEPSTQPFDNTKEILVLNLDSTDTALIAFQTGTGALTTANSLRLPPGTAVTLAIGPQGERNPLRTTASPAPYGSGANAMKFLLRAASGTPEVCVTYVQARGYVSPQ